VFALANNSLTITQTPGTHEQYYVKFTGGGTTGDLVYHLEVDVVRS
jgi:hypothetical protein